MATVEDFFASPSGESGAIVYGGPPLPYISSSNAKDDGGTVDRLAKLLIGGITKHGSTIELIHNVNRFDSFIIVGHGNTGYFETGAGILGYTDTKAVELSNEHVWGREFAKLWKPNRVVYSANGTPHIYPGGRFSIYACCIAGSKSGLLLLQRLADITNHQVKAFTGLIYVWSYPNGQPVKYSFERGHKWVTINPKNYMISDHFLSLDDPFNFSDVREAFLPLSSPRLFNIDFKNNDKFVNAEIIENEILSIFIELKHHDVFTTKVFSFHEADVILPLIFYSESFEKKGDVPGLLTAIITIKYVEKPAASIHIFADRIAEKLPTGETCLTAPNFRENMNRLFMLSSES